MKKKSLILLSLIPFALSACESNAEKNKKLFITTSGNCISFLKDIYKTASGEDIWEYDLDFDCYDLKRDALGAMTIFYIFQSLVKDDSFPVVSNTLMFTYDGEDNYYRCYFNKRAKQFYIDHCQSHFNKYVSSVVGKKDYLTRVEAEYDFSSNTVNSISLYTTTLSPNDYSNADVDYMKITNSSFDKCYKNDYFYDDSNAEKCVNDFFKPFKETYEKARTIQGDLKEKIDNAKEQLYDEIDYYDYYIDVE